jgi:hypothetical protein
MECVTVDLDSEPRVWVGKIDTGYHYSGSVAYLVLTLRRRQTSVAKQPPDDRLENALRWSSGERVEN